MVVFRDNQDLVTHIEFANMKLDRLPESSYSYYYDTIPVSDEYHTNTTAKEPPPEDSTKADSQLLDLTMVDPLLNLEIRYASPNNIYGTQFYNESRVLLQQPIAEAIFRIQRQLRPMGYGLKIYDAYRPWRITDSLWGNVPQEFRFFLEDPTGPVCQNRGARISVSVYKLNSGEELPMPTGYDELSISSHADFPLLPGELRHNRSFLRRIMESEGFRASSHYWWAFSHESCDAYPIMDILYEDVDQSEILIRENIYTVR